jgi:O-antigen ligase
LKKIIKVLLGTGLAISLVGMIQVIAYRFLGMNLFLNISNSSKVAAVAFEESVWFPQYITFLLSITLPLYFSNSFIKWKPQMTVCMCVFGIVIVSGLNRSSYVVTIAIVIVATILKIGGKRLHSLAKATVFLMMALLLASLIPSFFEKEWKLVRIRSQGEMFSFEEPANARRVDLATETLKHIKEHPFIGKGFGSWGQVVPPQTIEGGGSTGGSAFNVILGVLYDGGIIGLIALGLICYLYLKRCLDLLKITRNPYHKTIIYIAILVFTDIIITAQFHPVWLMGYAWLAIAMGMSITNLIEGELVNENRLSTAQLKSRWW